MAATNNWCFWTVVLEKTLESPLDCKKIHAVHPKEDQSWVFTGGTDAEAETPILWPPPVKSWLTGKDPDAGRDWGQEEKGTTEDEMFGWHHWLDGHGFGWTPGVGHGQGGLACCGSWGRKESDMIERLNWTELKPLCRPCRERHKHQMWSCTLPPLQFPASLVSSLDAPTPLPHPDLRRPQLASDSGQSGLKLQTGLTVHPPQECEPRNMEGIWQFKMGAEIGRVRLTSAVQVEAMRKKEWCIRRGSWSVGREEGGRCRQQMQKEAETQVEGETRRPTRKQEERLAHTPCGKFTYSIWLDHTLCSQRNLTLLISEQNDSRFTWTFPPEKRPRKLTWGKTIGIEATEMLLRKLDLRLARVLDFCPLIVPSTPM